MISSSTWDIAWLPRSSTPTARRISRASLKSSTVTSHHRTSLVFRGVKLTDFGVAKALGSRLGDSRVLRAYMSPEQVQHRPTIAALFGLGILLYETLTVVRLMGLSDISP